MRKVLGLDLGSASIGWAVIFEDDDNVTLKALGSRIVPLSTDDANEFTKGKAISKNASRTQLRTQRKGYDRYQQRRAMLSEFLLQNDMLPDETLIKLQKLELWGLRAKAVSEQLSLPEIGRVLYHINQKRGYKATKADYDSELDKKQGEYVKAVMERQHELVQRGVTIGQKFFEKLSEDPAYCTKGEVFPRRAYENEFDRIITCQKKFYPQIFADENIDALRNEIIFYQRKLKSCKHLISICDFEKREYKNGKGETVFDGPKVAPKSSPLAQVCKIWESVNNVVLKNKYGVELDILPSQRRAMFEHLDNNPKLILTDLYRILGISRNDGWWGGKAIGNGLQGNTTKMIIRDAIGQDYLELLQFNMAKKETNFVDTETGEVGQIVSEEYCNEPFYRLWHIIYSISDRDEIAKALKKQFDITDPKIVDNLFKIDLVKQGYANKSAKFIRRIIPYLELGLKYSDACDAAGFRHSDSLSKQENQNRELLSKLKAIEKNALRQPIVEKILNQMINVVNALMDKYGRFDEIRVELARELKQSKDERNATTININKAEAQHKIIRERIAKEYDLTPTRSMVQKYKMWQEAEQICFYCGRPVGVVEFLNGVDVEVEHIIPRSVFFDDGFSNKVCACRKCNKEKNNRTAYDYMKSKPDAEFKSYLERIERLYKEKKISKSKYERLLTAGDKIPTDFIDRQLRESQYISKTSREILMSVCRDVTSTSGSVTSFIRHIWGWDGILHNLNIDRYKLAGLVQTKQRVHKGNTWSEEVINGWSKRLDHRHHAIDALVIACTKQGYIQRINNMSELKDVNFASDDQQGVEYQEHKTKLERYIELQPHVPTSDVERAVDSILISFKAGKKAASLAKRYVHRAGKRILVQQGIIVPRGALHQESIYGKIEQYAKNSKGATIIEHKSVLKYSIESLVVKDVDFIVDRQIRELVRQRFANHPEGEKNAWKDLANDPLLFNGIPVKSVRCFTKLKDESMVTLGRGSVKLGNNHHIAIYVDREGGHHELCVTLWHAVERKKWAIPCVITNPNDVWDNLPEGLSDEFLNQLPKPDWTFEVSMQQNEMFVLGLCPEAFEEAISSRDYALLSKYLYRVQKIQKNEYYFRHHLQTKVDDISLPSKNAGIFQRYALKRYLESNPQKVRISLLGEITKI